MSPIFSMAPALKANAWCVALSTRLAFDSSGLRLSFVEKALQATDREVKPVALSFRAVGLCDCVLFAFASLGALSSASSDDDSSPSVGVSPLCSGPSSSLPPPLVPLLLSGQARAR